MESVIQGIKFFTHLGIWTQIAPYLGTYSEWLVLLTNLNRSTKQFWVKNELQFRNMDAKLNYDTSVIMQKAEEYGVLQKSENYSINLVLNLENANTITFLKECQYLKTNRVRAIKISNFGYNSWYFDLLWCLIEDFELSHLQDVTIQKSRFKWYGILEKHFLTKLLSSAKRNIVLYNSHYDLNSQSLIYQCSYNATWLLDLNFTFTQPLSFPSDSKTEFRLKCFDFNLSPSFAAEFDDMVQFQNWLCALSSTKMLKNISQLYLCPDVLKNEEMMDILKQHIPPSTEILEKVLPADKFQANLL